MREKSSEKQESSNAMHAIEADFRSAIERLGYMPGCRNQEAMISRAARAANISFSMAKRLFYGETTDPKTSVSMKIANALAKRQEEKASAAAADAFGQLAILAKQFQQTNPELSRSLLDVALGSSGAEIGAILQSRLESRALAGGRNQEPV